MTCCAHTTQVRVGLLWMTRVCPNDVQRGRLFCDEHGRDCAVCGHELECDDASDPDNSQCEDCRTDKAEPTPCECFRLFTHDIGCPAYMGRSKGFP